MTTLEKKRKIQLEYTFLKWLDKRYPGWKVFEDQQVLENPDNIHYFATEISELSPYDGEDYLDSRYALDGDFLRLEVDMSAGPGRRIKITCASANTEWLLNKTSYEDYDLYERLRGRLKKEGWTENEQHHWSRVLDWFNELEPEEAAGMFEEIQLNILENWGTDEEQPLVKMNRISSDDIAEHMIMLSRAVAYFNHDFGNGPEWRYFYYIDDVTRISDNLPEYVQTEKEAEAYLAEKFPGREITPFEYVEKQDYSQPKQQR